MSSYDWFYQVRYLDSTMDVIPPTVRPPSEKEIREQAAAYYMSLSDSEIEEFASIIEKRMAAYERLDELTPSTPDVTYTERDPSPSGDHSDPLNAFTTRCEVSGADDGPLTGYEIGLKDNISLAGINMTLGSKLFEEFVPSTDATIVTRLLDAGATITGKLNMEDMAHSGSGEISASGPVLNPYDDEYLAGGSSSGSAAATGNGDVDVSIGGDQAGSIRIPAAWSGIIGHKPTYGLVPYTGIAGLGRTFDHAGPMTTSVEDCALVLDVIAGKDPLDPRQGVVETDSYAEAVHEASPDITVGVVTEGFGRDETEPGVDETVQDALDEFASAGAEITEVSVPMHTDGLAIWSGIATEATAATVDGEGLGYFADGYYDTTMMDTFGRARRASADDFPSTLKLSLLLGGYLSEQYRGHYYGKAQNLSRDLAAAYDQALSTVDVLAMPTTPQTAHKRTDDLSRVELVERGMNMLENTAPFDVTGHPAISVPAGTSDGLPVGLMFIAPEFDDAGTLKAGAAFLEAVDPERT